MRYRLPPQTTTTTLTISPPGPGATARDYVESAPRTGIYHDSFAALAAQICGASLPPGLGNSIYSACPTNPQPLPAGPTQGHKPSGILTIHLAFRALAALGHGLPAIAPALQSVNTSAWSIANQQARTDCLSMLGQVPSDASQVASSILSNQNPDGGWEYDPMGQGLSGLSGFSGERSCVWRTCAAAETLSMLGQGTPGGAATYISSTRNGDGAWGYEASKPSDMYPTWRAVKAFAAGDPSQWVMSCQNHDGGFGFRPGWESCLESTYYALDILAATGHGTNPASSKLAPTPPAWCSDPSYHAWGATFETYAGNVSGGHDFECLAASAAAKIGANLVSPKYSNSLAPNYNAFAQIYGFPTSSGLGREAYSFRLHVNGWHWVHHSAEDAHAAGTSGGNWPNTQENSTGTSIESSASSNSGFATHGIAWTNTADMPWSGSPLDEIKVVYGWPLTRDTLDAAVDIDGPYNTLWCKGIYEYPEPVRNPWIEKYVGVLSPVTENDSHYCGLGTGGLPKFLNGHTVFIAPGRTWADFKSAVDENRTAYVLPDGRTWGSRWVREWLAAHPEEWQWRFAPFPAMVAAPITGPVSSAWGKYPWEIWRGGLVVRMWTSTQIYGVRIDGENQALTHITADQCNAVYGGGAKYYADYWYVERPDLSGSHTIQIEYRDTDGSTVTEEWAVDA